MHFAALSTGAAVLLALAPSTLAAGTAYIVNNCTFPVFVTPAGPGFFAPVEQLLTNGWSKPFAVGMSIKLATSLIEKPSQFEYSTGFNMVSYDISNIDGEPFLNHGMRIAPSLVNDPAFPTCKNITCAPGQSPCYQAYNQPFDRRTMTCNEQTDLTMTLCPYLTAQEIEEAKKPIVDKRHAHRAHARQIKW